MLYLRSEKNSLTFISLWWALIGYPFASWTKGTEYKTTLKHRLTGPRWTETLLSIVKKLTVKLALLTTFPCLSSKLWAQVFCQSSDWRVWWSFLHFLPDVRGGHRQSLFGRLQSCRGRRGWRWRRRGRLQVASITHLWSIRGFWQ